MDESKQREGETWHLVTPASSMRKYELKRNYKMKENLPLHLLINPNSNYYNEPGKKAGIELFEEEYNVKDLLAWSKITAHKYRLEGRKGKGEVEKDVVKLATYTNYYNMLQDMVTKCPETLEMSAQNAYKRMNMKWRYQ